MRILTGEEVPDAGNASLNGHSIRQSMTPVFQQMGYCPQFDGLFDSLTGAEHMRFYAVVKGLVGSTEKYSEELKDHIDSIFTALFLTEHENKAVK